MCDNLTELLSRVTDKIQERDGWADWIYLDLKKALSKVPHKRLLWKLEYKWKTERESEELDGKLHRGREVRTIVKDIKSEWRTVENDVSQGLVLALTLYLVYILMMPEGVKSYMSLFTGITKLLRHIRNSTD